VFFDREQVWWIVPPGQRQRHAISERPGARPGGDLVRALCAASVKIPYETWPATKEPASRSITDHCPACEQQVAEHRAHTEDLVVSTWDS
jgi:hypothetical protein